ncbi:hypothetical protein [Aurantimonas sp. Leaf443]|uniref:hypothetical protein n=1 Tax=Aurantimonas sp. Leaf443 TaxID=1736378 RepID=UPI0006FC4459|nr:hypothetical protein [Aurantimonas sp. Leaf443]KQT88226.1 hypothetical protein ASG48_01970 [Aurantimonas sp. Leaf443]
MLLAERLMVVLKREIGHLEAESKEFSPRRRAGDRDAAGSASPDDDTVVTRKGARVAASTAASRSKERIETLGQMTRSLEKLLELVGLERRTASPDGEADALERLREEMMARLRSLDAKRGGAQGLFGPAAAETGEGA